MIVYLQSKMLDFPVRFDTDTDIITVKDLKKLGKKGYVTYTIKELELLNEITPEIHLIKNIFDGEITGRTEKS